jgi:hypothetical protein
MGPTEERSNAAQLETEHCVESEVVMKASRVVVIVIGCLLLLPAMAITVGSAALTGAYAFARDDGWFVADLDRVQTPTAAVVSNDLDFFSDPGSPDWLVDAVDLDVRLAADAVDGEELFVGIAPAADVEAYLDGAAHDRVVDVDGRSPQYERISGSSSLGPPVDEDFWVESSTGISPTVTWEATGGEWTAVMMRSDGAPGLSADIQVGARSGALLPIAITGLAVGLLLVAAAVLMIVLATRRPRDDGDGEWRATAGVGDPVISLEHPVAVNARLDEDLSRWKWLVKWFLAIPHFVVMIFLWVAFVVTTFAAGVAILFTGRYPHRLFEFNLGVLRYGWRLSYYASSGGLGTDRYPPFSLGREPDYPAVLDIAYPEQLSRGLVLVKWWLLAIPHYIVLAVLIGGGISWTSDSGRWSFEPVGGGLLGLLVLIAGLILLVRGRYPRSVFDLVIGFNRWMYRVIAYSALMTDRYPPFRLDQGGVEPGSPLPPPPVDDADARTGSSPGRSA